MLAHYQSPLGTIELTFDGEALTGLRFVSPVADCATTPSILHSDIIRWLDLYFSGRQPDFMPKMLMRGSPFQEMVWGQLLNIPYGQTMTYGELARRVGCRSAQAVGGAVSRNPIALVVPCHRVIGSNGALTGYAYGLDRKRYLLELENTPLAR